ncbi:MAG: hypothetical protein ACRBDL_11515 [Alphaproteobacteria bacterium]
MIGSLDKLSSGVIFSEKGEEIIIFNPDMFVCGVTVADQLKMGRGD